MLTPHDLLSDAVCHRIVLLHARGRDADLPASKSEQTLLPKLRLEASLDFDRRPEDGGDYVPILIGSQTTGDRRGRCSLRLGG